MLARVLACCGRFLELLHPVGAERMARLRQAEAVETGAEETLDGASAGLEAMRGALAAVAAAPQPQAAPTAKVSPSLASITLPAWDPTAKCWRKPVADQRSGGGVYVFGKTPATPVAAWGEGKTSKS